MASIWPPRSRCASTNAARRCCAGRVRLCAAQSRVRRTRTLYRSGHGIQDRIGTSTGSLRKGPVEFLGGPRVGHRPPPRGAAYSTTPPASPTLIAMVLASGPRLDVYEAARAHRSAAHACPRAHGLLQFASEETYTLEPPDRPLSQRRRHDWRHVPRLPSLARPRDRPHRDQGQPPEKQQRSGSGAGSVAGPSPPKPVHDRTLSLPDLSTRMTLPRETRQRSPRCVF